MTADAPGTGRLKALPYAEMTTDQKAMVDRSMNSKSKRMIGPTSAWLRCPPAGRLAWELGNFARHDTTHEKRILELAIVIGGRHWSAQVAWCVHKVEAIKAGVAPEIIDAIEAHERPVFDKADEELVYDLLTELLETKQVSDETYARAIEMFGESKLIELIAIFGHYNHVAMVLNIFEVPVPDGWADPLKD